MKAKRSFAKQLIIFILVLLAAVVYILFWIIFEIIFYPFSYIYSLIKETKLAKTLLWFSRYKQMQLLYRAKKIPLANWRQTAYKQFEASSGNFAIILSDSSYEYPIIHLRYKNKDYPKIVYNFYDHNTKNDILPREASDLFLQVETQIQSTAT